MRKNNKKLHKVYCEIEDCNVTDPDALHHHHIIGRKELGTSNNPFNLATLCAVHHELAHSGRLRIIGVYPSTQPPAGRTLVYELDGKKNIDLNEPYFKYKPRGSKVFFVKDEYEQEEKKED